MRFVCTCVTSVTATAFLSVQRKYEHWFPGVDFREQVLEEWAMAKEELPLKACFKFSFGQCAVCVCVCVCLRVNLRACVRARL